MIAKRKNLSIRRIIAIIFILSMSISIIGIGYLVFSRWISSAEEIAQSISGDISDRIYDQIYSFMLTPERINEANHEIIRNGILDLSNERLRDKFFVGVLSAQHKAIYSFSYGTANGEYYGARRNTDGVIEIMRNNAATGGNSWYYSVNDDFTASELVVHAGRFDPRTRAWYKAAEAAEAPTFSQAYKHFVMDDLTISASWPVYDNSGKLQGVLGTHMLLSEIGAFMKTTVNDYNGYAIIIEESTGALIANSMGKDNFSVLEDGTLKRYSIGEIGNPEMQQAYDYFKSTKEQRFVYKGENGKLFIDFSEIHMEGLDWVVISSIPEGLYMTNIVRSINLTALLVALALIFSLVVYEVIIGRLLNPMNGLLEAAAALSSGDLLKRVKVVRNDEIGSISESLNRVADKMQILINNLEESVNERAKELYIAVAAFEENKNKLQLILDSTADAVYGIDTSGKCTFCNLSCIKLLGYSSQEELLGRNMHHQIHHSRRDGTPIPIEECRIFQSFKQGKGFEADDEVFWKADGTPFDIEYHSYPQIRNGEIVGGVITFMDISDRKKREKEIRYLSYHDTLTGFLNRRYFEESRDKIDIPDKLPLSVIFADINGLKMTNDIFGHAAGDELIVKSAEILKQCCRENDVIARIGGDEFIILLPKTSEKNAEKVISRIKSGFSEARLAAIKCSISLGLNTKRSPEQLLDEIIVNAENAMYKDKTINRKLINRDMIDTIVETLHSKSDREKRHSIAVTELCGNFGSALGLSEPEINKLKRAAYLHDIGKIVLDESLLPKEALTKDELEKMQQHSVVGYRILNLFDDTLDLAEYVYSHHERWDGKGYPRGLKGEQLPLISRIISITETYERVLNNGDLPIAERNGAALKVIKEGAGRNFDPEIAEVFVRIMER